MTDAFDGRRLPVAIVGGGQAGLSMSYCLSERNIEHVLIERDRVAQDWRERRWDSFCLVTPNWQCRLPGFSYPGGDPHGFMRKDEIVSYLEEYAARIAAPLVEGVEVTTLRAGESAPFELETTAGRLSADHVVVATGGYHQPGVPPVAERLRREVQQEHSSSYRNPEQLPAGDVLVVGTGQSGCQIAEDLHLAGRQVHLAVGGAPRVSRFHRGRDVTDWLEEMGHYDLPVSHHDNGVGVRLQANHYETGRDGGRDIDLRQSAAEGMELYGRLLDLRDARAAFADDLAANLDRADEVLNGINAAIDQYIAEHDVDASPEEPPYQPAWRPEPGARELDLDAAGIASVVWCTGFRRDYRWIELAAFDGRGYPSHERGVSRVTGLFFLGLPWLWTWGSGRFASVGRDAEFLAERIAARRNFGGVGALAGSAR
ncbi:MAG: MSMEG_0569 family flavin-dependent oxidoreductase [Actinomycetota bacterium]|nr:MSMEG_0569 family flavin-dependent oxidoreductase [Actinomycetota bacterium]